MFVIFEVIRIIILMAMTIYICKNDNNDNNKDNDYDHLQMTPKIIRIPGSGVRAFDEIPRLVVRRMLGIRPDTIVPVERPSLGRQRLSYCLKFTGQTILNPILHSSIYVCVCIHLYISTYT